MDLGHLFIDEVLYSTGLTYSDGDFSESGVATAKGRWEEDYKVITLAGGEERVCTHKFASTTAIELHAQVYGPVASIQADRGDVLRVLERRYARTLDGAYSYYIYRLGR